MKQFLSYSVHFFLSISILSVFLNTAFGEDKIAASNLWALKKNDKTIFLLGTLHTIGAKHLQSFIVPLIERSPRFYLETDPVAANEFNQEALVPDPKNKLKEKVSPSAWKRLVQELSPEGYSESEINGMLPQFAGILLAQARAAKLSPSPKLAEAGAEIALTQGLMDIELFLIATEKRIPIQALDQPDAALQVLGNVDLEVVINQTPEQFVAQFEKTVEKTLDLIRFYFSGKRGELKEATQKMNDSFLGQADFLNRHNGWISKFESAPNESFFAVGSLHLLGNGGLLSLLSKRGFHISYVQQMPIQSCGSVFAAKSRNHIASK